MIARINSNIAAICVRSSAFPINVGSSSKFKGQTRDITDGLGIDGIDMVKSIL